MVLGSDNSLEQSFSIWGVRAIVEYNTNITTYLNGGTTITESQKSALIDLTSMTVLMGGFLSSGYGVGITFENAEYSERKVHNLSDYMRILEDYGFTKSGSVYVPHKLEKVQFYGPAFGLTREAFAING